MSDELFLLIVGFLLTSVVGGALGAFFQNRAWDHRRDQERIDERRRQAMRTFEETSTLLDRRLYRMRQLW